MDPDISIVIPTYNRSAILKYVVNSVLAQTVRVARVIVVDDGSTDDTAEMMDRLISSVPDWRERVRYFYQANQGQSAAINNGLTKVESEWLGFTGQDDPWLPWKLEWQFRALDKFKECDLCFTDAWFMNNPHMKQTLFQLYGGDFQGTLGVVNNPVKLLVGKHPIWMQTVIARADLVHRSGDFDPYLRYSEDHDILFRMALSAKFCYVNMPMVMIDRSPADIRHLGASRDWHKEEFCLRMDQHRFETQLRLGSGLEPEVLKLIRANLRAIHSAWANWYLAQGQYENATNSLSAAVQYGRTPNLVAKQVLTRLFPQLAKTVLTLRDWKAAVRYDRVSWEAK